MADSDSLPISEKTASHIAAGETSLPQQIGRYRIERILGEGGFGLVFLAYDEVLERNVAVKVPHADRIPLSGDVEAYLAEARTVAKLGRHHAIVPVHDVGSTDDFPFFIVSDFIEGTDLARRLKQARLSYFEAAQLVETVAEALSFAHKHGVVHRDVKPSNILIGTDNKLYVVDFGLALREENVGKGPRFAGTFQYMSPEQARGEGHRVDGRSDIFSLGIVFYELIVGRRPFRADSKAELLDQITSHEPRPPRQYDNSIPKELERICLKMLSKRATDRYSTAQDVAEDLNHFLNHDSVATFSSAAAIPLQQTTPKDAILTGDTPAATPTPEGQPIKIVPKGLRSFDEHDADFFLELLPGPRDREGLPDSIRFWKGRIEETDADETFSVGLIYGPSGCGKSSLVKAGLLPRLSKNVIPVYVEATPEETEKRLLHCLRKQCPALEEHLSLKDTFADLRRGQGIPPGKKVLIVLDQFEQWLHATKEEEHSELVQALRQCNGEHIQCIVMVRDDFWMAATRFMRELEVRLVEDHNSASVDLFPIRHAEKVLTAFGRAFGILPDTGKPTKEQTDFVEQAVYGLADDAKVVCVRLALFAEMMKGKVWTPAKLKEVGGAKGIGVTFLEETFSASTAPPEHRYHQKGARAVLKALLPESGSDIKGHMRSYDQLLDASGYAARPTDFDILIQILDSEIRLITPTDPEGVEERRDSVPQAAIGRKYFQLTHDYLVPSLRDWLTRKQKETRRGRAELRLSELTADWHAKPESRHLPSLWEYVNIRLLTHNRTWTEQQRKMMCEARRRSTIISLMAIAIIAVVFVFTHQVEERNNENYANALVESLLAAKTEDVETIVNELHNYRKWATPQLERASSEAPPSTRRYPKDKERLHASLALVAHDPSKIDYLFSRMATAKADELPVIIRFLSPYKDRLNERLWQTVTSGSGKQGIRAAAALAEYYPKNDAWREVNSDIVTVLVSVPTVESKQWIEMLRPVGSQLVEPLEARYRDRSPNRDAERPLAAAALSDYLKGDPQKLTELILLADNDREFLPFFQAIRPHQDLVSPDLRNLLNQSAPRVRPDDLPVLQNMVPKPAPTATPEIRDAFWKKQANAAVCLLGLGEHEAVWPVLKHMPNPSLRSLIIDRLARLGADFGTMIDHLRRESDSSVQFALILALGDFDAGKLSVQQRQSIGEHLIALYRTNSDPGIHSAAAWTLRQWHEEKTVKRLDAELRSASSPGQCNWFVNSKGQNFVVVDGPVEFFMGDKPWGHKVKLSHRFAVATHEITVAQFQQSHKGRRYEATYAPTPDCPTNSVSWYDAVAYCNWLSEQEGIPKNQWCYEPNDKGEYAVGMKIAANFLQREGYRLPTEAEWEYACRANTISTYSFGEPLELLDRYTWCYTNSQNRMWPVGLLKPNGLGLFDMHGNAREWCHDWNVSKSSEADEEIVKGHVHRVLRGGAFNDSPGYVRSAFRLVNLPDFRDVNAGFRPARTCP